jgi:hypothetical protein
MSEYEMVVVNNRITYEGIFSIHGLYQVIDKWLTDKNYDKFDKVHTEVIKPDGKYIDIELEPDRNLDDYTKYVIRVRLFCSHLKDVTVDIDGKKQKLNEGKVVVILDSWVKTDWQDRMESKPLYHIIRSVYNKYIFKGEAAQNVKRLREETLFLQQTIGNYLNLWKRR